MNQRERNNLDRHITGNYGEDQLREESGMCIWDDCGNDAIYCEGHAREYMQPDIDALKALNAELILALQLVPALRQLLLKEMGYVPESVLNITNAARAILDKAQP